LPRKTLAIHRDVMKVKESVNREDQGVSSLSLMGKIRKVLRQKERDMIDKGGVE